MVNERRNGRFSGFRVNCEFVPCLPSSLVASFLRDPRRIPYLLIWTRQLLPIEKALKTTVRPVEVRDAARLSAYSIWRNPSSAEKDGRQDDLDL